MYLLAQAAVRADRAGDRTDVSRPHDVTRDGTRPTATRPRVSSQSRTATLALCARYAYGSQHVLASRRRWQC